MAERELAFEEFDIDDPLYRELSDNVYEYLIRHVVLNVTDEEIRSILHSSPYDNSLYYLYILGNITYSYDDVPKEGPRDYYINTVGMTTHSKDPIRTALRLASVHIAGERLTDNNIDDYVDDYEFLYKSKVKWLHEGLSPSHRTESTEDSRPDIDDD